MNFADPSLYVARILGVITGNICECITLGATCKHMDHVEIRGCCITFGLTKSGIHQFRPMQVDAQPNYFVLCELYMNSSGLSIKISCMHPALLRRSRDLHCKKSHKLKHILYTLHRKLHFRDPSQPVPKHIDKPMKQY